MRLFKVSHAPRAAEDEAALLRLMTIANRLKSIRPTDQSDEQLSVDPGPQEATGMMQ
jgi:hypothetical protein